MSGEIINHEGDQEDFQKDKIGRVFEKMEMMSLHKGDGIDMTLLNDEQRDKLIDVMQQNETHAFEYHTKKLDNDKEVKLAKINASTISIRSNRNSTILIISACFLITVFILFFKDTYLTIWLSFISGIAGGYGLGKFQKTEPSN